MAFHCQGTSYDDCLIRDNIIRGTGLAEADGTGIKCGTGSWAVVNNTSTTILTSGLTICGMAAFLWATLFVTMCVIVMF